LTSAELIGRIDAALTAGEHDAAAELLTTYAWVLLFGDPVAMRGLIARLSPEILAARPSLSMVMTFTTPAPLLPSRSFPTRLVPPIVDVDALSEDERDWYFMALVLVHRMRSEFEEAHEVAARVRPRLRRAPELQSDTLREILPAYFAQLGSAELLGGHVDRALADFEEASTFEAVGVSDTFVRDALVRAALVHALEGRTHEAERVLGSALALPEREDGYAARTTSRELLVRAVIATDRLDPDAEELVAAASVPLTDELWPVRLLLRARWDVACGNAGGLLEAISRARSSHPVPMGSLADQVIRSSHANALATIGVAERARGELTSDPARLPPLVAVARVRLMLYVHDPAVALQAARRLVARERLGPTIRAEALLLAAWAHRLLTGEVHSGYATAAGALIRQEELWRLLGLVPPAVRAATGVELAPHAAGVVARALVPAPEIAVRLTGREREVLRELASGGSIAEIAQRLHVSVNTVKSQVRSVYRRLDVNNRQDAVTEASRRGLLDPR